MDTGIALIQSSRVSKHARRPPSYPQRVEEVVFQERPKASLLQTFRCGIGAEMTYHLPHLKPYPIKPNKGHQRTKSIWPCHRWLNLLLNLLRLWLRWCCSLAHNSICLYPYGASMNDGDEVVSLHQAQIAWIYHSTCPERLVSVLNPSAACSVFGFPGPHDLQCSNRKFRVKVNSRSVVPDVYVSVYAIWIDSHNFPIFHRSVFSIRHHTHFF